MKNNRKIIFLFCITISIFGYAQEHSRTFGIINQADIDLKVCSFQPKADAVVLFDIGKAHYDTGSDGYELHFTRIKRIKILTEQGIKLADEEILYRNKAKGNESDNERIVTLEAHSINIENGMEKKKKVTANEIYETRYTDYYKSKKFAFPDVKVGTIIEYKYKVVIPNLFYLPEWNFQSQHPTIYSTYTVGMIPHYEYIYNLTGIEKLDFQSSVKGEKPNDDYTKESNFIEMLHTFEMYNVESFEDESYISNKKDYIKSINFQLVKVIYSDGREKEIISTWPKLVITLEADDDFGDYIKDAENWGKKNLAIIIGDSKGEVDKTQKIISYVKSNYKWNAYRGIFTSQNLSNLLKTKTGNIAEINLLLVGLLKSAGIEAFPIILSTRDHGKVHKEYPFLDVFNYIIVLCGSGESIFFTDATDSDLSYNRIPTRALNGEGLLVNKEKMAWVELHSNVPSKSTNSIVMKIDSSLIKSEVTVSFQKTDYAAYLYKKNHVKTDTSSMLKSMIEMGLSDINSFKLLNYDNPDKTLIIAFKANHEFEIINENLIIRPFLFLPHSENFLKADKRNYPVDFTYLVNTSFNSIVHIPDGFIVDDNIKKLNINDEIAEIKYDFILADNKITFSAISNFKKVVFGPEQYAKLKAHINDLISIFNQDIVLIKK